MAYVLTRDPITDAKVRRLASAEELAELASLVVPIEELVERNANAIELGSDRDKAMFLLFVDMWRAANPTLTVAEARTAVRQRLRFHLENIV